MRNENGAKAPLSAAQRKAAQRAKKEAMGLVRVKIPEVWHEPEKAKKLELDIAKLVQRSISEEYWSEADDKDNSKPNNC